MEDTLHYFFSTLAEAYSALVAFVFVAAQSRIAWLDAKITSSKLALLYRLHGGTHQIDLYMATNQATEVANQGAAKPDPTSQKMAKDLKELIGNIQTMREEIKSHVAWNIGVVIVGIVGLILVPILKECHIFCWIALVVCGFLAIYSAIKTGNFVYNSLTVILKENI